jgi:hypothetical protein
MSASIFLPYLASMQSACALLHCRPWPVWFNYTFPHFLINGTIFWKKLIEHIICVLTFSATFV